MNTSALLAQAHAWLAPAAAVVAGILVVAGLLELAGVVRGPSTRRWLDRIVLLLLALLVVAAVLGPVVLLLAGPPRDWLHLLYGVVALGAAPVARFHAARRRSSRTGAWLAVGGLVTLGALLRLWGTGG